MLEEKPENSGKCAIEKGTALFDKFTGKWNLVSD